MEKIPSNRARQLSWVAPLIVGAYWSVTTDLSKTYAGTLSGMVNTGTNVGGVISPSLTPWLADH